MLVVQGRELSVFAEGGGKANYDCKAKTFDRITWFHPFLWITLISWLNDQNQHTLWTSMLHSSIYWHFTDKGQKSAHNFTQHTNHFCVFVAPWLEESPPWRPPEGLLLSIHRGQQETKTSFPLTSEFLVLFPRRTRQDVRTCAKTNNQPKGRSMHTLWQFWKPHCCYKLERLFLPQFHLEAIRSTTA